MRILKTVAAVCFAAMLVGVPVTYLSGGSQLGATGQPAPERPVDPGTSNGGGVRMSPNSGYIGDSATHELCGVWPDGSCYRPYPVPTVPSRGPYPQGVERLLLFGATDMDDPGNATTSFLMAFFGVSAVIAGIATAAQKRRWILPTGLLASGAALFVAAQVLWNGADNGAWLGALAFLALNVAALAFAAFNVFRTRDGRRALTITIAGGLIVATILVQSIVFYELIGSPEELAGCGPTYCVEPAVH